MRRRAADLGSQVAKIWVLLASLLLGGLASATELAPLQSPLAPAYAEKPTLSSSAPGRLRFELQLSEPLEHQVFTLNGPDRLVVDFPELDWRLTDQDRARVADGTQKVAGLRVGLFTLDRARLVFDLAGPATVLRHASVPGAEGAPARFIIEFAVAEPGDAPLDATAMIAPTSVSPRAASIRQPEAAEPDLGVAPLYGAKPKSRPRLKVIALDAGHGGRDPGAKYGGIEEKWITLTFAQELKRVLEQPGRYRVMLTRDQDEFIELAERVRRARAAGADLFVSIHADALPGNPSVSGASVYTLSDTASDRLADALARRENAADALAGVELRRHNDDIRAILVDLAKKRTLDESHRFAELLIEELRQRVRVLDRRPHRYAGFRVLKTFDTPSVLVELGFMTNIRDRRRLTNPAWREQAALGVADAIRRWVDGERLDLREAAARR